MLADAPFTPTAECPPSFGRLRATLAAFQENSADADRAAELRTDLLAAAADIAALPRSDADYPAAKAARELIKLVSASGIHDAAVSPELLPASNAPATRAWPGVLSVMLLAPAWQWPDAPKLASLPHWLWADYVAWLFAAPQGFARVGDADAYAAYALGRLEEFHRTVERQARLPAAAAALESFARHASSIPLYFHSGNLLRHAELRAKLLSLYVGDRVRKVELSPADRTGRRLRVGFVNRHFGSQTETYTTLPTFEQLDPARFEVMLFTCHRNNSALEDYCRSRAEAFQVLPRDLAGQVAMLRAAALDVVVFGTNVTAVSNEITWIALHRVAPLQVVNNSSCITSGMPTIDLYVSGTATETANAAGQFTERLGLLPGPAHAFNYEADRQEPTRRWTRADLGLPEDATVFVSAANYFKIIPEMQRAWAKLLASVPGSYLLVHPFNPNWSSNYPVQRFCREFDRVLAEHGVATDRLMVSTAKFPSRADVKELLRVGDVCLDTFPFGGVNSLIDPLETGVPVVAWEGDSFRSRMGGALLRTLGAGELVAHDEENYLATARRLANAREECRALGAALKQKLERAPLFLDTLAASDAFGALLEAAFDELAAAGRAAFRRSRTPVLATGPDAADPASPELRHQLGRQLLTLGRADRALAYLMAAVQHEDANAALWHDVARAFQALKQFPQALQAAEACLRIDARNVDGWALIAELARGAGHNEFHAEAVATLRDLAPSDPRLPELARPLNSTGSNAPIEAPSCPLPRHVLVYTDDPQQGGVAHYNHNILLALIEQGFRVSCVQTESDSPLVQEQRAKGVRHHWLGYDTGKEFARTVTDTTDAERIFRAERPDLILFSDCCPVSNLAARQVAMARGIPYVVVVGFVAGYLAKNFAARLPMLAAQYAAARQVVAVSQENLALLHSQFGLGSNRGEVIHYGRPARYFAPRDDAARAKLRAEIGVTDDTIVCFTAARLTPIKGFVHQLKAAAQLRARGRGPRVCFVWAGDGEQRADLEREIARLRLGDDIKLLGQRWDVAAWQDAADIFVFPSHLEGMPLAIMEAMAKGLPVVATAVSGIPEELGDTGQLLPDPATDAAGVVHGLVETIAKWAADPALRAEVGRRGHERAVELFREELMVSRTLALLERYLPAASSK